MIKGFHRLGLTEAAVSSSEKVDEGMHFLARQRLCWPWCLKAQSSITNCLQNKYMHLSHMNMSADTFAGGMLLDTQVLTIKVIRRSSLICAFSTIFEPSPVKVFGCAHPTLCLTMLVLPLCF